MSITCSCRERSTLLNIFSHTTIVFIYSLLLVNVSAYAQDTIFLQNDSLLVAGNRNIYFAGGTKLVLDSSNNVIAGRLKSDTYLWTARRLLPFKGKSKIAFNKSAKVISGYLTENKYLWTAKQKMIFRKNAKITFNDDGTVLSGTLLANQLVMVQNKQIVCKGGKNISFYANGDPKTVIIAKREQLKNSLGKLKTYRAGRRIYFNKNNEVIKTEK